MNQWLDDLLPMVYRFALRLCRDAHLAEDLTQEALLRAWREQGTLRNNLARRAWTLRIAHNLWRDWQRRKVRAKEDVWNDDQPAVDRGSEPNQVASDRDEARRALAALDRLPQRQREVLYLLACEEMTIAEIAEALDMTYGAVKTNLSLARKRMRQQLQADEALADGRIASCHASSKVPSDQTGCDDDVDLR